MFGGFRQSNMQVTVSFAFNSSEELNAANSYTGAIRLFQVLLCCRANMTYRPFLCCTSTDTIFYVYAGFGVSTVHRLSSR